MGIKITASEERVFRLRGLSEDDTIFLHVFEYYLRMDIQLPVPGGTGAGFLIIFI